MKSDDITAYVLLGALVGIGLFMPYLGISL
jgi:hypothetical protein